MNIIFRSRFAVPFLLIIFITIGCSMPFLVTNDPQINQIQTLKESMDIDDATVVVTKAIIAYYHPQTINVTRQGYQFVVPREEKTSAGMSPATGEIPFTKTGVSYFESSLVFGKVLRIEIVRYRTARDMIMFWKPRRYAINLITSQGSKGKNRARFKRIFCYEKDKNKLLAALMVLSPN